MVKFFFILVFSAVLIPAQTAHEKWTGKEVSYTLPSVDNHRDYLINFDNPVKTITKSVAVAYWVFISDLDGNNCPFRPSCSSFFVQAAEKTNPVQGLLMFMDRFTRDLNIINRHQHYPQLYSGYYYDPVDNYTLDKDHITYIPPHEKIADK
ncbi:MAG: hypothetical protein Kow0098_12160 [Ignavibacteriaceae bacterium]